MLKFNFLRKKKKVADDIPSINSNSNNEYMYVDPLFVGYPDEETQYSLYNFMMRYTVPGESILDFGAGRGDLYGWMQINGRGADKYTGLELNSVMVSVAKSKYPGIDIRLGNWSDAVFIGKHDWAINAFSITAEYTPGVNFTPNERLAKTINEMLQFANYGVCIGLLLLEEEGYISYSIKDIIEFCETNNFSYILDKSYNNSIVNLIILNKQI